MERAFENETSKILTWYCAQKL